MGSMVKIQVWNGLDKNIPMRDAKIALGPQFACWNLPRKAVAEVSKIGMNAEKEKMLHQEGEPRKNWRNETQTFPTVKTKMQVLFVIGQDPRQKETEIVRDLAETVGNKRKTITVKRKKQK